MTDTTVVSLPGDAVTVVSQTQQQVTMSGTPGLQGPASLPAIGGYGFDIDSLAAGDVLQFGGSAWRNTPQQQITDGGNF